MGFVFIDIINHGMRVCVFSDEKNFALYHNSDIVKIRVCHKEGDGILKNYLRNVLNYSLGLYCCT